METERIFCLVALIIVGVPFTMAFFGGMGCGLFERSTEVLRRVVVTINWTSKNPLHIWAQGHMSIAMFGCSIGMMIAEDWRH